MKIYISISKNFFNKEMIANLIKQSPMSRQCLIYLSPDDFLKLAAPGHSKTKEKTVKNLIDSGTLFEDTPYLSVETRKDGDVEVGANGLNHEGRHRARALKKLGVKLIPVELVSEDYGDGPPYRWGKTKKRPKFIYGYNGSRVPFPKTLPYKGATNIDDKHISDEDIKI